jgi:NAD-dependent deacetylase
LHQRAGSTEVIEYHGNIVRDRCNADPRHAGRSPLSISGLPECAACGELLRPDVVWFGEMLDPDNLSEATEEASRCQVMLVVGTSGLVYPAAGLPAGARRGGAAIITVNPDATELDGLASVCIRGKAAEVLPQLLETVR